MRIPSARAKRTAWATSAADPASTTTAGRWSATRFHAWRASSKPWSPGTNTSPPMLDCSASEVWRSIAVEVLIASS
jgi:hypothetical protein